MAPVSVPQDADAYEERYVHQVYAQIASHFSSTRYKTILVQIINTYTHRKPWPIVERFLQELPSGSIGLDVGCGNGKYLAINPNIFILASDRFAYSFLIICLHAELDPSSESLVEIASQRQPHASVVADNLLLPHPNASFDFAISIAVVHHMSTRGRRVQAIAAVLETLRSQMDAGHREPGDDPRAGRALVYVWALEQKTSRRGWDEGDEQDVMVPWVMKSASPDLGSDQSRTFNRYYHLYRQGELEDDIAEAGGKVLMSGYEKDNWWAIAVRPGKDEQAR
ncbi:MAG: hypothetical protein L6R35_002907 [Caloplaca aegaea]|nr:MAG: hypothetical protein L6R35_002907 [Caloplaca aegaea]